MSLQPRSFYIILMLLTIIACQKQQFVVRPAFYFWQTHLDTQNFPTEFVQQQKLNRLYICLLNIEVNAQNQAKPSIETKVDWSIIPNQINIVPVIYIPNRVFERMDSVGIEHFVQNL